MERRYAIRFRELLDDAVVEPEHLRGMLTRLEQFVVPFAACLVRCKQRELTQQYVAGLVSAVERKNVESIAYHHDQDRQALQKFIGQYTWDHRPLIRELVRQVGESLGEPTACWSSIPRRFPRRETHRSAWRGNGADAWEKWRTARWACTWLTLRPRNTPWSTCGCICPRSGRGRSRVAGSAACRRK